MSRPRFNAIAIAVLGCLISSSAIAQPSGRTIQNDRRAAATAAELQRDLRDARKLLVEVDNRRVREQLELLLSRAALKAEDLGELLARSTRGRAKLPISDADFAKLVENIKDQAFDDDKIAFIKTFVKDRPLSCEQATTLLKTISFDAGRSEAAVLLYPGLVDQENFFEVLKVFPFAATRKKVMEAVRKKD